MASVPTLGYWFLRGRGAPIRYLLKYAGVEFNDKIYEIKDYELWFAEKPTLGLDFPNLPYYIDDDIKLSQSMAILKYLGRKHGLMARDDPTLALQELVEQQLEDMKTAFWKVSYTPVGDDVDALKPEYITATLEPQLNLLVKFLGDKQWLTGSISYVDFYCYEILDWLRRFTPETIAKYPTIGKYLDRFEALPAIKAYLSSAQYVSWPLFGPRAKWGGIKM